MTADPTAAPVAKPAASPLVITAVVMLGTFMTILDSTIANVAIPKMQPSLGAASDTITWVLTSYIVATAVATPLTGWLASKIGRRQLFLWSVAGFTLASLACGLAQDLGQMVVFRMIQGATGATLAPLGQAYVLDVWPREKHGKAMSWWGVGIMVGPILGPVLGAWLTDNYDWRWVFLINLPVGVVTLFLASSLLPRGLEAPRRFDLTGFAFLALGVAALQLCLDRGEQLDWFESWEVRLEAGLAIAGLWAFGVHVATTRRAGLVDRSLLRDRNVMTGFLFITVLGMLLVSTTALLPPLQQNLLGYPVLTTGYLQVPRGIGIMLAMMAAGQMIGKIDTRIMIGGGFVLAGGSMYLLSGISPAMDSTPFITAGFIQGVGLGLVFVPLNTIAFSTLAPALRTDAAGFYMLLRNLGGSLGISLTVNVLARQTQVAHADLASHVTPYSAPWADPATAHAMGLDGVMAALNAAITQQAAMIAFVDVFRLLFWITCACLPLLLLLKPARAAGPAVHLAD
ncbi:disulfide bond formation protein DsbA [alpha proteobacterium AAP81b]|nr:disulfide bond formation protein DsbA [alpha proteobacterium AAP81b]